MDYQACCLGKIITTFIKISNRCISSPVLDIFVCVLSTSGGSFSWPSVAKVWSIQWQKVKRVWKISLFNIKWKPNPARALTYWSTGWTIIPQSLQDRFLHCPTRAWQQLSASYSLTSLFSFNLKFLVLNYLIFAFVIKFLMF